MTCRSAVYDGLITSVRANLAPLFRYYELRRRVLGLEELHQYDTYVPLVPEIETHVSFDEAIEKVLASLAPLGRNTSTRWATGCAGAGAIATRRRGNGAARSRAAATGHRPTS